MINRFLKWIFTRKVKMCGKFRYQQVVRILTPTFESNAQGKIIGYNKEMCHPYVILRKDGISLRYSENEFEELQVDEPSNLSKVISYIIL